METADIYESWDCPNCNKTNFPTLDDEEGTCTNCGEIFELERIE